MTEYSVGACCAPVGRLAPANRTATSPSWPCRRGPDGGRDMLLWNVMRRVVVNGHQFTVGALHYPRIAQVPGPPVVPQVDLIAPRLSVVAVLNPVRSRVAICSFVATGGLAFVLARCAWTIWANHASMMLVESRRYRRLIAGPFRLRDVRGALDELETEPLFPLYGEPRCV
jgi:hypothetical protein